MGIVTVYFTQRLHFNPVIFDILYKSGLYIYTFYL